MSFCFGFVSNDSSMTACALSAFRAAITRPDGAPNGWGMAYYQAGQPLLRKQPKRYEGALDLAAMASNLRTNLIVGHVRAATVGSQRTENTHPFRYRSWTFAHAGTLDRFETIREDMLRSIPDFIRRNIRGKTDSEHLFHLFLSFLNDTGKMDDPRIPVEDAARALASTYAYLERMISDKGGKPGDECCIVTNGDILLAYRRGMRVQVARQSNFNCPGADGKPLETSHLRAVMLAGGSTAEAPGWEDVADRCIVTVDRALNIDHTPPLL